MIERFDHAVIGVPDLDAGMDAFRRLGFEVAVGGRHPSLGTRNAIVRFGLDYLELLTVEFPATARARGAFGTDLMAFLAGDSGLVGYVLAGSGLEAEVEAIGSLGIDVEGPFAMDRVHPRGGRLEWRLVLPGGSPWRRPWPYLIDWITSEEELLAWDPPGNHANQVTGVVGIELVVEDLEAARQLYEVGLGLLQGPPVAPGDGSTGFDYRLGNFVLGVHRPAGRGTASVEQVRRGPGPFRLVLASGDLAATAEALSRNGVPYAESPSGIDLDPADAAGARLRIIC